MSGRGGALFVSSQAPVAGAARNFEEQIELRRIGVLRFVEDHR